MNSDIKKLEELLSSSELAFFQTLAPSYKKNFVNHAFSGKKEETRLKNIDEVKGALELQCKNIFDYKKKINPREEIPKDLDDRSKVKLYFDKIESKENKDKIESLYFDIIANNNLKELYAWNQPMITYKDTFICAFSVAKNHFSIGLDQQTLEFFREEFAQNNYEQLKKGIKIKWDQEINKDLIDSAIKFTKKNKENAKGFWE